MAYFCTGEWPDLICCHLARIGWQSGFLSLFHQRSGLCRSVVNLDLQHWIVGQQFFRRLFGGTFVRKLGFEMPIDDHRISNSGNDVSPLDISGLLFFDAESWLFHVSYSNLMLSMVESPRGPTSKVWGQA
jgi:hypothetical protein